ncbi:MAG: hypothetical protein ACTSU2_11490 [Promethearchaeota archaeon]
MANLIIKRENEEFEIENEQNLKIDQELMQKIENFIVFAKKIKSSIYKGESLAIEGVILEPVICKIIYNYPENKINLFPQI